MATDARGNFRRGTGRRLGQHLASVVLVLQRHREPSLDTPNARPVSASSQGPKLTHGNPQTLRIHLVLKKSIRSVTDILFRTFSSRVLSLSRCSPEIHQILYNLIHYTFVFHLSPVAMMPEFNGNKKKNANDNGSGQVMPAEFDLPTAIFVVVAGMVE